ncbi:Rab-GTPase-TBC domain [Phytophthora infestans]|uniref:Rab-GTPase-TBC domain n=2 Tax=Phytophthora infestans TaxID=4787 RepID=A0A8S9V6Q1_PHYIN|nr:Rab-GTPase-TBC domain [Phytophthora infestans]KAF4148143.1 Rab-GTPase-TBC domain [Phytophthora infestans]
MKDESSDNGECAGREAPVPLSARTHGRQLACFRPKRRFRLATASFKTEDVELACRCEHQVLQCLVDVQQHTASELNTAEDLHRCRLRKWSERFAVRDWAQERLCQKWKGNQKRFTEHQESTQKDDTKPAKTVKMALSSFASAAEQMLHSRQFDGLLRAGVPPHLRGQVWWMCSGAAELRRGAKESYPALLHRLHTLSKCAEMDIEKDLPRTFPLALRTSMRQSQELSGDGDSFGELRRVLQAYSLRNPAVGYCQSMNFLAAVLLQNMGEAEAFWVLAAIVEELTPQYHTRTMTGSRADQRVFSDLVTQKLPVVASHLQTLGVDFEPFTLKWFLCLFLNTLPFEPVMRIWDVFFCEGSHVLLRVGLVLLKLNQPRIMACDDALDVYEMFKVSHETLQELTAPYRSGLLNRDECVCDTLIRLAMDKSFLGTIPFDSLHELRQYYRGEIEAELEEAEARRLERQRSEETSTGSSEERALMKEYDFVDDYACSSGSEASPARHIRFMDLYDSDDASADYFVDVMYDFSLQHHCC